MILPSTGLDYTILKKVEMGHKKSPLTDFEKYITNNPVSYGIFSNIVVK